MIPLEEIRTNLTVKRPIYDERIKYRANVWATDSFSQIRQQKARIIFICSHITFYRKDFLIKMLKKRILQSSSLFYLFKVIQFSNKIGILIMK